MPRDTLSVFRPWGVCYRVLKGGVFMGCRYLGNVREASEALGSSGEYLGNLGVPTPLNPPPLRSLRAASSELCRPSALPYRDGLSYPIIPYKALYS